MRVEGIQRETRGGTGSVAPTARVRPTQSRRKYQSAARSRECKAKKLWTSSPTGRDESSLLFFLVAGHVRLPAGGGVGLGCCVHRSTHMHTFNHTRRRQEATGEPSPLTQPCTSRHTSERGLSDRASHSRPVWQASAVACANRVRPGRRTYLLDGLWKMTLIYRRETAKPGYM